MKAPKILRVGVLAVSALASGCTGMTSDNRVGGWWYSGPSDTEVMQNLSHYKGLLEDNKYKQPLTCMEIKGNRDSDSVDAICLRDEHFNGETIADKFFQAEQLGAISKDSVPAGMDIYNNDGVKYTFTVY